MINDKWVGLDVTISQQVTRGAKLEGELPPQAGEVLHTVRKWPRFECSNVYWLVGWRPAL